MFYTSEGVADDPYQVILNAGANYVRLRVWNNPASGQCSTSQVASAAKKAKAAGHKVLVDFHYSDTWADPDHQTKPLAWSTHDLAQLTTDVHNFTFSVCEALKAVGATPDSVQLGNEINTGMLWQDGKVENGSFSALASLLKAGRAGVKACDNDVKVIIHTAFVNNPTQARTFYDGIQAEGVAWDILGLSYYCYSHGTFEAMQQLVRNVSQRYITPVCLMETAYPFTTLNNDSQPNVITSPEPCSPYLATPEGQGAFFADVQQAAADAGAVGVFYWEPAWVAVAGNGENPYNTSTGDAWENQAGFNFSHQWNRLFKWGVN
ncbi:arabinogalactan endo-1 [Diplonema papillatum]|nr:arabinogalactan endo-1 [Diplonema papillatum]